VFCGLFAFFTNFILRGGFSQFSISHEIVSQHKFVASISNWTALSEDEDQLAGFLANNNPISICLDATGGAAWLQFYKSGIANPKHCSDERLNHAVLIVGYGEQSGTKYWTVRNSWGANWGESG
jgi:cathepsin F